MTKHLGTERISGLLDEPWSDREGQDHLEACADCQLEFERLSRMRMALSALPDEEPPANQWAAIEARLDAGAEVVHGSFGQRVARRFLVPGPLQAAAAVALFAGGIFAGLQFTASPGSSDARTDLPAAVGATGDERVLMDGLTQFESLRAPLRQVGEGGENSALAGPSPREVAEALLQLDGIIRATRERLEENPDDAFASAYLLDAVEMRDRLAQRYDRTGDAW